MYKALLAHVRNAWPENIKERYTWQLGPIQSTLPDFSVLRVDPASSGEAWIYLTQGAWEIETGLGYREEFFLVSPVESPRHIETLVMLAYFHADPKNRLDVGSCVNIGRGWIEGATCDHLLVSLPYPYGPKLEYCTVTPELTVRFRWLLPITAKENDYLRTHGLEALEQKFQDAGIDYLDPKRAPVIG